MPNPDFRVCTNIPLKNINQTALLRSGQTELFTHFLADLGVAIIFCKSDQLFFSNINKRSTTSIL